jgi:hypothetical protein
MHENFGTSTTVAIVTYRSSKLKRLVWNGMEWNKMRGMSIVSQQNDRSTVSKSCLFTTHVNSCSSPNHTSS